MSDPSAPADYQYKPNKPDGSPWTPPKQTSKRRRKPASARRPHPIATSARHGGVSPAQASASIPAIASSSRLGVRTPASGYQGSSPTSTKIHWAADSDCVNPRALQALERWDSRSATAIDEEEAFDEADEDRVSTGAPSFAGLDNYVFPPKDASVATTGLGLDLDLGPVGSMPLTGGYALSVNPSQDSMLVDIDPLAPSPFLSTDRADLNLHNLPGLAFDGTPTSSGPPSVFNQTPPVPAAWPGADVNLFSSASDPLSLPLPPPSLSHPSVPFSSYDLAPAQPDAGVAFDPFDFAWTGALGLDLDGSGMAAASSKLQVPTPLRPFGSMATVLLHKSPSPDPEPFDPQLRM